MPFAPDFQQAAHVEHFSANVDKHGIDRGRVFDASRIELAELRVGSITYPLRHDLTGHYVRALEELFVNEVSPLFVGKGRTAKDAINSFSLAIHVDLQRLLHARPFEMTSSDRIKWNSISDIVDLTVYRNTTPIEVRQFGEVSWGALPYPNRIRWDTGYTEAIHPCQVQTPDFVTFKPGQPIEAVVLRDPITRSLHSILSISRTRSLRPAGEDAGPELAPQIGSSADLPDASWD